MQTFQTVFVYRIDTSGLFPFNRFPHGVDFPVILKSMQCTVEAGRIRAGYQLPPLKLGQQVEAMSLLFAQQ